MESPSDHGLVRVTKVADLEVSAASGLVVAGERMYVIADDELSLDEYPLWHGARLRSIPLLAGVLPESHAARKAAKPDFEALALLPGGWLLALGSGSTAARRRGAALRLADGAVRTLDLSFVYEALADALPALNIEGAAVVDGALFLLQRGNGRRGINAVVELGLTGVLNAIEGPGRLGRDLVHRVRRIALGELAGVPLGFTDATPSHDGRLLFSAAAEDSVDTYDDGPCHGSAIGLLSAGGHVDWLAPLDVGAKVEGLCLIGEDLALVADPDDPGCRAPLYAARLGCR